MKQSLVSPQVIAAVITGAIALIVALIPVLTRESTPTPTPTFTATSIVAVATAIPTSEATQTQVLIIEPTASLEPTEVPIVPTNAPPANVVLLYDDVSFTIHNQSSQTVSVNSIRFQSSAGIWDAIGWGASLVSVPANNCLRLRDTTSGQRQPPSVCGNLFGLQLVGSSALFWLNTDEFQVLQNGTVIATCLTANDSCPIYIP